MTVDVAALFLREARRGVPRPHENGTGAQGRSRGLSLMRLADFIDGYAEDILIEWEQFAATKLPAAAGMGKLALRDHAPLILRAIATDLRTAQSAEQERSKAEGRAMVLADAPSTA